MIATATLGVSTESTRFAPHTLTIHSQMTHLTKSLHTWHSLPFMWGWRRGLQTSNYNRHKFSQKIDTTYFMHVMWWSYSHSTNLLLQTLAHNNNNSSPGTFLYSHRDDYITKKLASSLDLITCLSCSKEDAYFSFRINNHNDNDGT